jgi:hypothetical protein
MLNTAALIRAAAASVAGIDDPRDRLAQQVGYLQGVVRSLCGQYLGEGAKPQAGCSFFTATAGDSSVIVEYEYQPGEEAIFDLDSPMCGPGSPETVSIIQALVNGAWCDPADVFSEALIERWAEQIAESEAEAASEQREGAERNSYDDARDFAGAV